MSKLLNPLKNQLKELGKSEVVVKAKGHYPRKGRQSKNTKVQDVFFWQNYGTKYIKASNFLEKVEQKTRGWSIFVGRNIYKFLFKNDDGALRELGRKVASDINRATDRIDTRRLMHSQKSEIE